MSPQAQHYSVTLPSSLKPSRGFQGGASNPLAVALSGATCVVAALVHQAGLGYSKGRAMGLGKSFYTLYKAWLLGQLPS